MGLECHGQGLDLHMDKDFALLRRRWSVFEIVEEPNHNEIRLLWCVLLGVSEDQEHTVCDVSHWAYPSDTL